MSIIKLNAEFINFSAEDDKETICDQIEASRLLSKMGVDEVYTKRSSEMDLLTDGNSIAVFPANNANDFMETLSNAIANKCNDLYFSDDILNSDRIAIRTFVNSKEFSEAVLSNSLGIKRTGYDYTWYEYLHKYVMGDKLNCKPRSPKFSKFLVKLFGESSKIVRMFNDRPNDDQLLSIDESSAYELVVSNLVCNVMKMTTGNRFDSCQCYESSHVEYVCALPSSMRDDTLSIAYLKAKGADGVTNYLNPTMHARLLIAPLIYNGETFYIGYNIYGSRSKTAKLLKDSLKVAYGERFILAEDLYYDSYSESELFFYKAYKDFDIRYEGLSESRFPYVNNGRYVIYDTGVKGYTKKASYAPEVVLKGILEREAVTKVTDKIEESVL